MRNAAFLMLLSGLAGVMAMAGDLELALNVGMGFPSKKNLHEEAMVGVNDYFLMTRAGGSRNLVGLEGAWELFKDEKTKLWLTGGLKNSFGSSEYTQVGQVIYPDKTSTTQILNGNIRYLQMGVGVAMTFATGQLGEYGLGVDFRNHRVTVKGDLINTTLGGNPVASRYKESSNSFDMCVKGSVAFVQAHPTFKTFQRIGYGIGLGRHHGDYASLDRAWRVSDAHLDRLRPTQELTFAFGVRL